MKKFLCVFISTIVFLSSLMISASAQEGSIYEETRSEIDLSYLNVSVVDGKKLKYNPRSGFIKKIVGNREKEKLDDLLVRIPEYKDVLIETMNHNEPIHTLSLVNVPVVWEEDHYERVKKENTSILQTILRPLAISAYASNSTIGKVGDESPRGVFTMVMAVSKQYYEDEGEYKYKTLTTAQWGDHSWLGGENYPATGEDYIAVSVPYYMQIEEQDLIAQYINYKDETREGSDTSTNPDFWLQDIGTNYCGFKIEDDPPWTWQLDYCMVSTTFAGVSYSQSKKATSRYVHTWYTMEFEVTILLGSAYEETQVVVVPSKEEKSWQCACDVVFDF